MQFQVRWHMFRRPIYVLEKNGKDFVLTSEQRTSCQRDGLAAVRLDGLIHRLHSEEELKKLYWRKVGTFGRRTTRDDSPQFLFFGKQIAEKDLNRPAVFRWEEPLGRYT
jgi:hypothetical protein